MKQKEKRRYITIDISEDLFNRINIACKEENSKRTRWLIDVLEKHLVGVYSTLKNDINEGE